MKRITYNGQSLITGTGVSDALVNYVAHVAAMAAAVAIDIPVLEPNNTVVPHTLLLSAATQLEVAGVDGVTGAEESERFPVPALPPVGGQASPIDSADIAANAPVIDEDPMGLIAVPEPY
ncbi:hypothetical protein [Cryobacterium sp.]|uniref:hypothetical protein n=1 Tax=Cryobacterium sp. TaxID=1926290 RepID=UPI002627FEEA|nr:hypothetical protein [Cryobacterium sp.]MCU1446974.1 hypothetical protein [Cryobacterium sp.]